VSAPTIAVRPGTRTDQEGIAAIRVATWRDAYAGIVPAPFLASLDPVAQGRRRGDWWSGRPDSDVDFVAERDGELVGFVHGGRYRDADDEPLPGAGEVYAIYVLPPAQGTGAGGALLSTAVDALHGAGFGPLLLWVLTDNAPARRFYERRGWAPDGVTHTYEVGGAVLPEVRYRLG
jgi:GNAT superfamily N-acetyltransferase